MSACRRITDIYICCMLLIFPLFTGFSGYANITFSKFLFFTVITVLWLLFVVIMMLRGRVSVRSLRLRDPSALAAAAFLLVSLISSLFSPWFPDSILGAGRWDGFVTLLLYVLIFLFVRSFGTPKRIHVYLLAASLTVNVLISVIQMLGYNPLGLFPGNLSYFDAHIKYSGEFLGTIGNVDVLSAFLCICVPLFVVQYVSGAAKTYSLIPAALGMFLLLKSGVAGGLFGIGVCAVISVPVLIQCRARLSRAFAALSALLISVSFALLLHFDAGGLRCSVSITVIAAFAFAVVCGVLANILHLCKSKPDAKPKAYLAVILILLFLLILLACSALHFYKGTSGTVYELSQILHGEIQDNFGSSRIKIWRNTLTVVREKPIIGGGCGTLADRLDILFSRYVPETGKTLKSYVDNAHNLYLTVLADSGILGLAAFLTLLGVCFMRWIWQRNNSTLFPAIGSALLCYAAEEFFGLNLFLVAPLFWIFLGLLDSKTDQSEMLKQDFNAEQDQNNAAGELGS